MFFTTMDLTYAFGQLPLNADTNKHCNFFSGRKIYRKISFRLGLYGLKTMLAEFQCVMDAKLPKFPYVYALIDDILVTSNGSEIEHIALVKKILEKLHKKNGAETREI